MNKAGFSYLELLLFMGLGLPLVSILVLTLNRNIILKSRVYDISQNLQSQIQAKGYYERVISDLDLHRIKLLPIIHRSGAIHYKNDSLNTVSKRTDNLRPTENSDAITSIRISAKNSFKIISRKKVGNLVEFTACPIFNLESLTQEIKAVIALSPSGFAELVGSSSRLDTHKNCRMFTLSPVVSMSTAAVSIEQALSSSALIPIIAHYTLYVDSSSQLRYLSHLGEQNIENQPLIKNINKVSLVLTQHNGSFHLLKVQIAAGSSIPLEFNLSNHLSRKHFSETLLNLI